jgi:hypothetical protein
VVAFLLRRQSTIPGLKIRGFTARVVGRPAKRPYHPRKTRPGSVTVRTQARQTVWQARVRAIFAAGCLAPYSFHRLAG